MRRFNQQTWFCIAAVWLAGSLSMYWAEEIRIPAQELVSAESSRLSNVIRRHQDLIENVPTDSMITKTDGQQVSQTAVVQTPPLLTLSSSSAIAPTLQSHQEQLLVPESHTSSHGIAEKSISGTVKANGVLRIPDTFDDQQNKQPIESIRFENQTKMPEQPALWLEGRIELSE